MKTIIKNYTNQFDFLNKYPKEPNPHKQFHLFRIVGIIFLFAIFSCKKAIQISAPTNTITTQEVFADNGAAAAAVRGIYGTMMNGEVDGNSGLNVGNGSITLDCGESADELLPYQSGGDLLYTNKLNRGSYQTSLYIWQPAYTYLYQCNSIIEGLSNNKNITLDTAKELTGEAKFVRAFFDFYLVNLFGNIPLVTSSDFSVNQKIAQSSASVVNQAIIADLKDAQNDLPKDYSEGAGERIRPNYWAATALLAREYLYTGDWKNAEAQSSSIIANSGLFSLDNDLNEVFLKNNPEAILQLQINTNLWGPYTFEGNNLIPPPGSPPNTDYLTTQLLSAFEPGDKRRQIWVGKDSTSYDNVIYYYPYKYTVRTGSPGTDAPQYYMLLRLAEQYLIRAEAEANGAGSGIAGAISDVNVIRHRAGLPNTTASDKTTLLAAIAQERRIELFAEWGHRWLDLKRTGTAHAVLSTISYKQPWVGDYQLLYPIPASDVEYDPNLKENPGY